MTIVTPFGTRDEFAVKHLRAPGIEGDFGVLPGHTPFMTSLKVGVLVLDTMSEQVYWSISGGFAEVLGDRVTILAETAEKAVDIQLDRAELAKTRAEDRLAHHSPDLDVVRAQAALAKATNRLRVAHRYRSDLN